MGLKIRINRLNTLPCKLNFVINRGNSPENKGRGRKQGQVIAHPEATSNLRRWKPQL
jgi:hypothetical protein